MLSAAEREAEIEITEEGWHQICETQCTPTNSTAWREFCWKDSIFHKNQNKKQESCSTAILLEAEWEHAG